jgi:chemotaxis protein methyltransferase CheR
MEPSVTRLCDLVEELCGVALDQSKLYMIRGRLRPLLEEFGFPDYETLARDAEKTSRMQLRDRLVDALTTNETLFFRDRSPFDALKSQILPALRDAAGSGRPRLRIWSAACSTGQEPYSLAMTLLESLSDIARWDISIMATDVSPAALAKAREGRYPAHEMDRGVAQPQRERFFTRSGETWEVRPELKRMIQFGVHNLHKLPPATGPFEIIYCRNVAIYFKKDARAAVFDRLASRLAPGGYLFVGCSESLHDLGPRFKAHRIGQATCYRPNLLVPTPVK